jgi:hypothetical protein
VRLARYIPESNPRAVAPQPGDEPPELRSVLFKSPVSQARAAEIRFFLENHVSKVLENYIKVLLEGEIFLCSEVFLVYP